MNCEFCKKQVVKKKDGSIIFAVDKCSTNEGGEIRCCKTQKCIDKIPARKAEIDTWISGQKAKESAQIREKYNSLKDELSKSEYTSKSGQKIIARLNDKDLGIQEDNPIIHSDEIKKCFDLTEFKALSISQLSMLSVMVAGGNVDLGDAKIKDIFDDVFPIGTQTRTSLEAKRVHKRSIAQNLGFESMKKEDIERGMLI